jgi:hypothetical protein
LSTPIALCLAVFGTSHVLIGRDAPLLPPQRFYQRAHAQDLDEVTDQANELLKKMPLLEYNDEVVLPGLVLAEIDFTRGLLARSHIKNLNEVLQELIDELSSHDDTEAEGVKSKEAPEKASADELQRPEKFADYGVACVWGRGPFDKAVASILAQLLERLGLKAELEVGSGSSKVVRLGNPELKVICLSSLAIGRSSAQIRYSIRRMRNRFSQAKVVLCSWGQDLHELRSPEQATNGDADCYAFIQSCD